jgi:N6-adenosine-specific RNA methylase IME4
MNAPNLQNPVLYQNDAKTITLIDIPTSIVHAQVTPQSRNPSRKLLSTEPLKEPFASTEPTSEKARKNLAQRNSFDQDAGEKYVNLIEKAIKEVREKYEGEWCLERRVMPVGRGRKRKINEVNEVHEEHGNGKGKGTFEESSTRNGRCEDRAAVKVTNVEKFLRGEEKLLRIMKAVEEDKLDGLTITISSPSSRDQNEPETGTIDLVSWDGIWYNQHPHPILLTISEGQGTEAIDFYIPPLSTFLLSDCKDSSNFRNTLRSLSSTHSLPRHFNLIFLDPPWPNTSAKRKGSYSTASALRDLKNLLLSMDLDTYIASSGYIGIWITNAPSIRNLVLGSGGLFEAWNASLVEEWIWVKTTVSGEPVTKVEGLWRKPYETLLLGRAPGSRMEVARSVGEGEVVKRIIFGVPDLHSRKPCLKSLVEGVGMVKEGGKVLEVFARYCVAGWWSWGNEVLKFNWDGYWEEGEDGKKIEDVDV